MTQEDIDVLRIRLDALETGFGFLAAYMFRLMANSEGLSAVYIAEEVCTAAIMHGAPKGSQRRLPLADLMAEVMRYAHALDLESGKPLGN